MDDRELRMRCLELASQLETMVVTDAETVVAAARLGQAEIGCAGHRRGRRYV
jgi:hypothetical protein